MPAYTNQPFSFVIRHEDGREIELPNALLFKYDISLEFTGAVVVNLSFYVDGAHFHAAEQAFRGPAELPPPDPLILEAPDEPS